MIGQSESDSCNEDGVSLQRSRESKETFSSSSKLERPTKSKGSLLVDKKQETIVQRALAGGAHQGGNLGKSILQQESLLNVRFLTDDDENLPPVAEQGKQDAEDKEGWKTIKWWKKIPCSKRSDDLSNNMEEFTRKKSNSFSKRALKQIRRRRISIMFDRFRSKSSPSHSDLDVSNYSRMQKLVMEMRDCLLKLENILIPDQKLEEWACLVYESMSASSRTFHGVQHVFDMAAGGDEIQKLSAYYHDCIYYNIDGGLSSIQKKYLSDIIFESDQGVFLTGNPHEEATELVTDIFGFVKGQKLNPFKGLNEYLSAVLAARCFAKFLRPRFLAEVATCIEATIPFREGDPMDELYQRLVKANEDYDLGMSFLELEVAVKRAADFANRDVYNFSLANKAVFLSNTWNLLPESNIKLRHPSVFKISDFAVALQKMTGFFSILKAETIFSSFRNEPTKEIVDHLTRKAKVNIEIALKYMQCKSLSISVLGAFAELTGGDAPVAMFLGDLPDVNYISPSIEDMIKIKKKKKGVELDERVLALLTEGRESESEFDIKKSPCAALLYNEIGDEGLEESLKHIIHPMDEEHAKALLLSLPKSCVTEIGFACCHIAITRTQALKLILEKIQVGSSL